MFNIIPTPQIIKDTGKTVAFNGAQILNNLENMPAINIEKGDDFKINITVNPKCEKFENKGKSEGYVIDIKEAEADIIGYDEKGAFYACITFNKLIKDKYTLPVCTIIDYPHYVTRGHFMECRYGSDFMTLEDWKKAIDYFSEMKINKLVIGLYGCWPRQYDGMFAEYQYIPFKKYPQLKTPRHIKYYSPKQKKMIVKENVLPVMYEDDYFGEMVAYGKEKHVEIIPLFNSLGHNTLIPRLMPEISAEDENGNKNGLGFCTNNPKTYEVMFSIYDEIIDRYLKPSGINSFEIGLDEVFNMIGCYEDDLQKENSPFCKCKKCRDVNYGELMVQYIIKIAKYLKTKGIDNLYVYYDMLFENDFINEETANRFKAEGVYDMIVIDWWSYRDTKEELYREKMYKVNNAFRSVGKPITGYFHWTVPTQTCKNIDLIREVTDKLNWEGMISYSCFEYCYDYTYRYFAQSCWNPEQADKMNDVYIRNNFPDEENIETELKSAYDFMYDGYGKNRNIARKDGFDYYPYSYLLRNTEYPQHYPAKAFQKLADNPDFYEAYLEKTVEESRKSYKYFSGCKSEQAPVWKLCAGMYLTLCDDFLTIHNKSAEFNKGDISKTDFINELERLITQRDEVMELCEEVRIKANQYTIMRNMTVIRQAVLDLKEYLENNEVTEINPCEFDKYLSEASWFLR